MAIKLGPNDSVANGDKVEAYPAYAKDGDNNIQVGSTRWYVDGTVAIGQIPTRWEVWTANSSGVLTQGLKVDSSQALTMVGGSAASGRSVFSTVPIGSVAYGSFGTNTSAVANTLYLAEVFIPRNFTCTGIGVLNGSQATNGVAIVSLYNTSGTKVANSASTATSGTNAFQQIAFTATYAALGPARYWIGVQMQNVSDTLRTIAASTFVDCFTDSQVQGSFVSPATATVPTSFSANKGPIAYVY